MPDLKELPCLSVKSDSMAEVHMSAHLDVLNKEEDVKFTYSDKNLMPNHVVEGPGPAAANAATPV